MRDINSTAYNERFHDCRSEHAVDKHSLNMPYGGLRQHGGELLLLVVLGLFRGARRRV